MSQRKELYESMFGCNDIFTILSILYVQQNAAYYPSLYLVPKINDLHYELLKDD